MFENPTICSSCQGKCCKTTPGIFSPSDFSEISAEVLSPLLKTGRYTFESQRINKKYIYFLRPTIKGYEGCIISSGSLYFNLGECTFLTSSGCELSPVQRPYECKNLEPQIDYHCKYHGIDNDKTILKWHEYYDLINEIIKK